VLSIWEIYLLDFYLGINYLTYDVPVYLSMVKIKGIEWFENIILISSQQDDYVPFYSANI
jgi:hypothetical protein